MNKSKQCFNYHFLAVLLLSTISQVSAQSTITDAFARLTPQANGILFDGNFMVEVSDTTTNSAIEVKLGSADGLSDLVNYTFNFDVNSGLPTGYIFNRIGNICTLSVGTLQEANTLYGSVRVRHTDNSWTSLYSFISN